MPDTTTLEFAAQILKRPPSETELKHAREIMASLGRLEGRAVSQREAVALLRVFAAAEDFPKHGYGIGWHILNLELLTLGSIHDLDFTATVPRVRDDTPATIRIACDAYTDLRRMTGWAAEGDAAAGQYGFRAAALIQHMQERLAWPDADRFRMNMQKLNAGYRVFVGGDSHARAARAVAEYHRILTDEPTTKKAVAQELAGKAAGVSARQVRKYLKKKTGTP